MKKFLWILTFMSFSILASERQPYLIKHSATGFVPAEWARSEKCEVFDDQVLLTRTYGKASVTFQIPFSSDDSLTDLILKATEESMTETDNYLCDGPSTVIKANLPVDEVSSSDLLLYSTGGCGSPRKQRIGPYSMALMDIVSTFCAETH